MNKILSFIKLVSHIGVKPEYEILKKSKIILTNQFSILSLTFPIYFAYLFYVNMPNNYSWVYQSLYIFYPFVLYFNHKGWHKFAAGYMIVIALLIEFLLCSTFGYESGEHINLISPLFVFFVIYNWENFLDLVVIIAPTLITIIALFVTDFSLLKDYSISEAFLKENYISTFINIIVLTPIFGYINFKITKKQTDLLTKTQSELAKAIVSKERENYELIFDNALDAVLSIDIDSKILAWNKQAEKVFGWQIEEVLGKNMVDIIIPYQHRLSHQKGMSRFISTGESTVLNKRIEITGINRNEEEFPIELSIVKIMQDNKITFSAFIRDLSERYRAENEIKERKEMISQTNKMLAELRLNALKSQINPHFYFNTLNNLYGLALTDNEKTSDAILRLSGIMEYIIYDCNSNKVALSKELEFIKNYIEIEKLRYFNSAEIKLNISNSSEEIAIAPMILIQFIENAFKHGIQKIQNGGFLHIDIKVLKNDFFISIINEKPILHSKNESHGIGLQNAKNRLHLLYHDSYKLEIEEKENQYEVKLYITLDNSFD